MSTYEHDIFSIFDPAKPDENVFMYTVGLYPERQELCVFNVPRNCVDKVGNMMNYLSTRTLLPGQTAGFNYHIKPDENAVMPFVLDKPTNAGRKRLLETSIGMAVSVASLGKLAEALGNVFPP